MRGPFCSWLVVGYCVALTVFLWGVSGWRLVWLPLAVLIVFGGVAAAYYQDRLLHPPDRRRFRRWDRCSYPADGYHRVLAFGTVDALGGQRDVEHQEQFWIHAQGEDVEVVCVGVLYSAGRTEWQAVDVESFTRNRRVSR